MEHDFGPILLVLLCGTEVMVNGDGRGHPY